MKSIKVMVVFILALMVTGCSLENKQEEQEKDLIADFVKKKGITVDPLESGLYYVETTAGTGDFPINGDTVFIIYTGKYLTDVLFDTNVGKAPFGFVLGEGKVINGMEEGIMLMKKGGKAGFLIPSKLAYGPQGLIQYDPYYGYNQIIPGYTPLWFDVELTNIKPGLHD